MSIYSFIHDVPEGTIQLGIALGLMRYDEKGEVYKLTPKGSDWFNRWLDEMLAQAERESGQNKRS